MRYHRVAVLSVLVAALLGGLAKPLSSHWDNMHTKHTWNIAPKNWESLGSPPSGTTIDLYFALKSDRENALIDALNEVSSPGHPKYRVHFSKEKVAELVAPHPNTLELVNSWLEHHGVPSSSVSMTHGGNTLMLKGVSVTQANALLGASYQLYKNVESGETIVRTVGYALPAALHMHVLTVAPTTSFVSPHTQWQTSRNLTEGAAAELVKPTSGEPATMVSSRDDGNYITPSVLRWLYDTSTYTPTATADDNVLGILVSRGLSEPFGPGGIYTQIPQHCGGRARQHCTDQLWRVRPYPSIRKGETRHPLEYAAAMAHPTRLVFFSNGRGPSGTDDWFISSLAIIFSLRSIPQTISTSYFVDEDTLSKEYSMYVCYLFAQLGLRGISILASTGDCGVGQGNCVTNDGSIRFRPQFPATCPYVTAVGGTMRREPEIASSFSGGGFSNYFPRPIYQERAVSAFLQGLGSQYRGFYNATGRGIPDIAAQTLSFKYVFKGRERIAWVSCSSAAVVAGIISLLNDYLISRGQDPLGFLNPWLYANGFEALWDISSGSNPGCTTNGFSSVPGWDPVCSTGLVASSLSTLDDHELRRSRVTERLTSSNFWRCFHPTN